MMCNTDASLGWRRLTKDTPELLRLLSSQQTSAHDTEQVRSLVEYLNLAEAADVHTTADLRSVRSDK